MAGMIEELERRVTALEQHPAISGIGGVQHTWQRWAREIEYDASADASATVQRLEEERAGFVRKDLGCGVQVVG